MLSSHHPRDHDVQRTVANTTLPPDHCIDSPLHPPPRLTRLRLLASIPVCVHAQLGTVNATIRLSSNATPAALNAKQQYQFVVQRFLHFYPTRLPDFYVSHPTPFRGLFPNRHVASTNSEHGAHPNRQRSATLPTIFQPPVLPTGNDVRRRRKSAPTHGLGRRCFCCDRTKNGDQWMEH